LLDRGRLAPNITRFEVVSDMIVSESEPAKLLAALAAWEAPTVTKWIGQPGA